MIVYRNIHGLRFPNIYILSNIIYYVLPLSITIVLVIKASGFPIPGKLSVTFLQCIMVKTKVIRGFLYFDSLLLFAERI